MPPPRGTPPSSPARTQAGGPGPGWTQTGVALRESKVNTEPLECTVRNLGASLGMNGPLTTFTIMQSLQWSPHTTNLAHSLYILGLILFTFTKEKTFFHSHVQIKTEFFSTEFHIS